MAFAKVELITQVFLYIEGVFLVVWIVAGLIIIYWLLTYIYEEVAGWWKKRKS